jgi:hypothetical protein
VMGDGVRMLDLVIQRMLKDDPSLSYDGAVRQTRIDGQALAPHLVRAAYQLEEARRQGLLRPGDEER